MLPKKDVNSYIASAPKESQEKLLEFRKIIQALIPDATEEITYGMPTFKYNGKSLIAFAGYKHHIGFYPMSGSFLDAYKKELKDYKTTKGAVQFPLEKPLPLALIKKLVKGKLQQVNNVKDEITEYTQYHKDGSLWGKGQMIGDKMHGYWEWFRKEGTKMRSGYFEKGKQVGKWITYDKKGDVYKTTIM